IKVGLVEVEAGVVHGIDTRGDAVVHELVHAPGFLGREIFAQVEVLHAAAEAAWEIGGVETRDGRDAAHAIDHIVPGRGNRAANRRDDAKSGNDYATLAQCSSDLFTGKGNCAGRAGWPRGRIAPRGDTSQERSGLGAPIVDVADCLLDGRDLLGFFIRDLDLELLFKGHYQLNRIQRVSTEIIDE